MNDRYVFDLDNTLIMTDKLNNEAYNYALNQCGMLPISIPTRITREVVFNNYPDLTESQKSQMVKFKQDFFINNIHCTYPNTSLIELLQSKKAVQCILWTRANANRAESLLKHYRLENQFITIMYSDKRNIFDDIRSLCSVFECTADKLHFYENDVKIANELKELGQRVLIEPPLHAETMNA